MDYRNLLLDPCSAKMIGPVGSTIGTGLFARYRQFVTPVVDGEATSMTAALRIDPNKHQIAWGAATAYNVPMSVNFTSTSFGILTPGTARAYRIVAACIKWVPTGAVLYRSGVVRSIVSREFTTISGRTMGDIAPLASHTATNGSEPHEVVYFPSDDDLEFRTPAEATAGSNGSSICLAVDNVDCSISSLPTVQSTARGYFDVTWVAEWMPEFGTGMTTSIVPPTTTTLAQLYDTVKPFAAIAANAAMRMAFNKAMGYIARAEVARLTG